MKRFEQRGDTGSCSVSPLVLFASIEELSALLKRTREVDIRLYKSEPHGRTRQKLPRLFQNGDNLFNQEVDYGLSHTVPLRITREQTALFLDVDGGSSQGDPDSNETALLHQGFVDALNSYTGIIVCPPWRAFYDYEGSMFYFFKGELSAQKLVKKLNEKNAVQTSEGACAFCWI